MAVRKPLTVATDGSCLRNPGGAIGWAWADELGRWQASGWHSGTNQVAELLALLSVLRAFPNTDLHVQMDSQYAMNIAEKWMWGWASKNWTRGKSKTGGKPISNLEIVKAIHHEIIGRRDRKVSITYEWVKGHAGHALNELVDKEAGNAAQRAKRKEKQLYRDSSNNAGSNKQNIIYEILNK